MATCKDCLHWKVCNEYRGAFWGHKAQYSSPIINASADSCIFYKDRSRFVELPCKVGDTLYIAISDRQIVLSAVVTEINISEASLVIKAVEKITYTMLVFMLSDFGSTVFMAKEEAEQALAKQNQPDNTPQ